jgi:transcriptional regulator GlxA family with amidase domain
MPFDSASPELFEIDLSNDVMKMLEKLVDVLNGESEHFDFKSSLLIQSILTNTLLELPEQIWSVLSQDERVEKAVRYIEGNLSESLSNEECAKMVSMATNSFARLFQTDMGISLGQYILKRRMAQACQLLHHTQSSIDLIADEVGFCNRHHFSRMFKKVIGESPAFYRKTLRMKPIKS